MASPSNRPFHHNDRLSYPHRQGNRQKKQKSPATACPHDLHTRSSLLCLRQFRSTFHRDDSDRHHSASILLFFLLAPSRLSSKRKKSQSHRLLTVPKLRTHGLWNACRRHHLLFPPTITISANDRTGNSLGNSHSINVA